MIREICKDEVFLAQKAELATADDLCVAQTYWKLWKPTRRAVWAWRPT